MLHANSHIDNITPAIHGGIDYIELQRKGLSKEEVLDFSVSCNPFGPPDMILKSLNEVPIDLYPDSQSSELLNLLSHKLGILPENIIVCNGSTELIRLAVLAYVSNKDKVIIPQPTYGDYEQACSIIHAGIVAYCLPENSQFQMDVEDFIAFGLSYKPKAIFLCNPNNPTGQYMEHNAVKKIILTFKDSLVILDEAYIAFTQDHWNSMSLLEMPNLLIARSMTKDYALAGLRIGYGVASKQIIDSLKKVRPPWNVNAVAARAGATALTCDNFLRESTMRIFEAKQYLGKELTSMGFRVLPSQTNYFLFKAGDARKFRELLLPKGFVVRDCTSFGLPDYIRIAPRKIEDCIRLIQAVGEIIGKNNKC